MSTRLVAAAAVVLALPAHAASDFQLWTSAALRYRVAPRTLVEAVLEVRSDEDTSTFDGLLPSVSVTFDGSDLVRLGLGYCFEYERDRNDNFDEAHRLYTDATLRGRVRDFGLTYRLRYQAIQGKRNGFETLQIVRNRVGISYDTGRQVRPGASMELFTRLGDQGPVEQTKLHLTIGAAYDAGDHEIAVFYRIEKPLDDSTGPLLHIIGIGYELDLARRKPTASKSVR